MDDPRCCGGGACIIDPEGRCWCGQVWDGTKMAHPVLDLKAAAAAAAAPAAQAERATGAAVNPASSDSSAS